MNIYVFKANENINVLEALAKHRCEPTGKQNVYQRSASLLERNQFDDALKDSPMPTIIIMLGLFVVPCTFGNKQNY